jgi:hypothetical protein
MLQGSARMVLESGLHPAALKDQVTTPGRLHHRRPADPGGRAHPFGARPRRRGGHPRGRPAWGRADQRPEPHHNHRPTRITRKPDLAAPTSASNVRVPITRPQLGKTEADAVARVVRSRWVIQGPEVAAFENELAAAVGSSHAVAVSSGTAALELALRVLGVGPATR